AEDGIRDLTVTGVQTCALPIFGKVNNTLISGEDHEIFMRLRRRSLYAGYYDPELTVRHYVPPGRLTRRYFRQWYFWHGKTQALKIGRASCRERVVVLVVAAPWV